MTEIQSPQPVPGTFPVAIWNLLLEVADRKGTQFTSPWEGPDGEPLQDDADAAIAWIKAAIPAPEGGPAADRLAQELEIAIREANWPGRGTARKVLAAHCAQSPAEGDMRNLVDIAYEMGKRGAAIDELGRELGLAPNVQPKGTSPQEVDAWQAKSKQNGTWGPPFTSKRLADSLAGDDFELRRLFALDEPPAVQSPAPAPVPMCSEQAVLHALTMARSETHKQGDAALWQAFGRAMWRQFNAMAGAVQSPAVTHQPLPEDHKRALVAGWFAEDWAIEKAMGMLGDYDCLLFKPPVHSTGGAA